MSIKNITTKALRNAGHLLNKSGLLEEDIVIVGLKKAALCRTITDAVDTIPEDEDLDEDIINVYNDIVDATNAMLAEKDEKEKQEKLKKDKLKEKQKAEKKKLKEEKIIAKAAKKQAEKERKEAIKREKEKKKKLEKEKKNKNKQKRKKNVIISSLQYRDNPNKGINKDIRSGEGISCFGSRMSTQAGLIDEEVKKETPKTEIYEIAGCSPARFSGHIRYLLKKGVDINHDLYVTVVTPKKIHKSKSKEHNKPVEMQDNPQV